MIDRKSLLLGASALGASSILLPRLVAARPHVHPFKEQGGGCGECPNPPPGFSFTDGWQNPDGTGVAMDLDSLMKMPVAAYGPGSVGAVNAMVESSYDSVNLYATVQPQSKKDYFVPLTITLPRKFSTTPQQYTIISWPPSNPQRIVQLNWQGSDADSWLQFSNDGGGLWYALYPDGIVVQDFGGYKLAQFRSELYYGLHKNKFLSYQYGYLSNSLYTRWGALFDLNQCQKVTIAALAIMGVAAILMTGGAALLITGVFLTGFATGMGIGSIIYLNCGQAESPTVR